jgi:hypothetical protein
VQWSVITRCTRAAKRGVGRITGERTVLLYLFNFFSGFPLQDFKPVISVNVAGGKTRLVPLQVEYTLRSTFSTRGTIFYKIQDSINQAVKVHLFSILSQMLMYQNSGTIFKKILRLGFGR